MCLYHRFQKKVLLHCNWVIIIVSIGLRSFHTHQPSTHVSHKRQVLLILPTGLEAITYYFLYKKKTHQNIMSTDFAKKFSGRTLHPIFVKFSLNPSNQEHNDRTPWWIGSNKILPPETLVYWTRYYHQRPRCIGFDMVLPQRILLYWI